MGFVGADSGELRDLAKMMQRSADRLDGDVVTAIASNLRSNPWSGPDAVRFRGTWSRDSVRRLNAVAQALREAAGTLERNAAEQDEASAGSGGVGRPFASQRAVTEGSSGESVGSVGQVSNGASWLAAMGIGVSVTKDLTKTVGRIAGGAGIGFAIGFGKFSPRVAKGSEGAGRFMKVADLPLVRRMIAGADVKSYTAKRAAGSAAALSAGRGFSTASKLLGRVGRVLGPVGVAVSLTTEATKQYQMDAVASPSMDVAKRVARATVKAGAVSVGGIVGAKAGGAAGAAAGMFIAGPPGAVVGGVVGAVVGGGALSGAMGWISDVVLNAGPTK